MTAGSRARWGGAAGLGALALIAAGATAGFVLAPEVTVGAMPELVGGAVPVTAERFSDAHVVAFETVAGETTDLTVRDTGLVTRVACEPGGVIASGSSPVTVDDRPTLVLATEIPLWRDLGAGAQGEDVRALQVELGRLGYAVEATGRFGTATRKAVNELLTSAGATRPGGVLRATGVIWLPEPGVTVTQCPLRVGDESASAPLATTGTSIVGLRAAGAREGWVPGERSVTFGDVTAPMDDDGLVVDPMLLAAVASSPVSTTEGVPLTLEVSLTEPVDVVSVPAAALVGLAGDRGCVTSGGVPRPVRLVASSLGRTMVVPLDEGPSPTSVDVPPKTAAGCA